jgi:hypothetical protein
MDKVTVNLCNHEEGTPSTRNENWTQMTAHLHKRHPCKLSKSPSTIMRTASRFDVLHNLKEHTMQTNTTKKLNHKANATTQGHKVNESDTLRTNKVKDKEEVLPVFDIPVLVNGCIPFNKHSKVPTSVMTKLNNSNSDKVINVDSVHLSLN